MDLKALEDAVRDMDRRKVQDDVSSAAKSGLDAAASVGTETPMVILRDIRRCIIDMSDMLREQEQLEEERETRREARHGEMIATLQQIASQASYPSPGPRYLPSRDSIGSTSVSGEKRIFYWHDLAINTGAQVVSTVFMQLDAVLRNSGQIPDTVAKDSVMLDLKGWSSAILKVAAVESGVTVNGSKLSLPKLSNKETTSALEIVSSTTQGRAQPFRVSDALRLQELCGDFMGIVEEVRQRLIRCPGIIPDGKRTRLAYLKYPYVTREGELNIDMIADGFVKVGPQVLDFIPKFKDDAKKLYVLEVLGKGTAPIIACNKSKKLS